MRWSSKFSLLILLILLILSILVGGCSMASLAIKNLDWIIARQVKNHLDLYYNQEKKLEVDISHFLKRQKVQVTPLSDLLAKLSTQLASKKIITLEDVEEFRLKLASFYIKIADDFNSNLLSKYLAQINTAQLAHFRKENTQQNIELKDKITSGESNTFKRIEFFTGDFTADQKKVLTKIRPHIIKLQKLRLKRRKELQIKLYQVIASTKEDKQKTIQSLFYHYVHKKDVIKDKTLNKRYQEHMQQINKGIVSILNTLSKEQKKTLNDKIKWMQDVLNSFNQTEF